MDLILRGGHVVDARNGIDGPADVAIADGRIAAVGAIAGSAREERDVSGMIVAPGLIDFHSHVYWGGSSLGVEPEPLAARSGVTTFVDAGTAGAANFWGFRAHVIEPCTLKILPFLNLSYAGIYAYGPNVMVGEAADLRLLDMVECRRVASENRDLVVGIKVRLGRVAGGASGIAPLDMAIEVAEEVGLPVMAHIDQPPPTRREVLERLRPGDILTHCFKPFPNALLRFDGTVREEVVMARERGIVFDIGHGGASFGFAASAGMLAAGFKPDVISSDVHALCINGPAFDLVTTMSKFLALGLAPAEIIARVTDAPGRALSRSDIGTLTPGTDADVTVLDIEGGSFGYVDSVGERLTGRRRFRVVETFVLGRPWRWSGRLRQPPKRNVLRCGCGR